MRNEDSDLDNGEKKVILVFDTAGFLAKYHLYVSAKNIEIYTVPRVLEEVKDRESLNALEAGLVVGRVKVFKPSQSSKKSVAEKAKAIGEYISLTETDLEVAALAYELKSMHEVVVITDDYSLQNLLLSLGIPFKPLRTYGVKELRTYLVYCKNCGYVSPSGEELLCPICGSRLTRKKH